MNSSVANVGVILFLVIVLKSDDF